MVREEKSQNFVSKEFERGEVLFQENEDEVRWR